MSRDIQTVLERLDRTMRDPSALEAAWRENGRLEDGVLGVWVGRPAPSALDALAAEHEQLVGAPLDPMLRALWARFDGIAIAERGPRMQAPTPGELAYHDVLAIGEPTLWPVARYASHFDLLDLELPGGGRACTFGDVADSGFLVVSHHDHAVYWQDIESHRVPPHLVAANVAEFLEAWIDASLSLPRLLGRAGASGWGA